MSSDNAVMNEQYLATDSQEIQKTLIGTELDCCGSQGSKLIQTNCILFDTLLVSIPCAHAVTFFDSCPRLLKSKYLDVTVLRRGVGEVRAVVGRAPACWQVWRGMQYKEECFYNWTWGVCSHWKQTNDWSQPTFMNGPGQPLRSFSWTVTSKVLRCGVGEVRAVVGRAPACWQVWRGMQYKEECFYNWTWDVCSHWKQTND
jgi:hypothetical protein